MSERLTLNDLIRFAYGHADELEETILADDEYIAALEDIWAAEMTDLTEPILRAIHLERLLSEGALAALDTGDRLIRATLHYLTSGFRPEHIDAANDEPADDETS